MKYFKNYFTLVLLVLLSSSNMHAQLFGGQARPKKPASIVIPPTITLAQNRVHFIASINDSDYLPYLPATTAATTDTNVNADGTAEATAINVQGTITTTGITVRIPVIASGSGTLPAFSTSVNIPASLTEDETARDVTLSWASQGYTATTTFITATIAAVGGTLNAKKLDINAGIGNDALGVLMATLTYPYNNAGATTTYQIRDIAGIPDRNFGVATTQGAGAGTSGQFHNFLYLPTVAEDGRIWLNHNLGADYTNLNSVHFNPGQKATGIADFNAGGSLFQWGRLSDGHELILNRTTPAALNSTTTTLATTNVPVNRLFIVNTIVPNDWRSVQNNNLWQGVTGINNPCPVGFRLPTEAEFITLRTAASITDNITAVNSILGLGTTGVRAQNGTTFTSFDTHGNYWTSTVSLTNSIIFRVFTGGNNTSANLRAAGNAIRCIQETASPATLTIDCDGKTSAGTLSSGVAASGVSVSIPYTGGNSGWLAGSSATSTGVTGLTATYAGSENIGTTGNVVFTITGTPASSGIANFSVTVNGVVCAFSYNVNNITIPATITLAQNRRHFIASINDSDYLPYQPATTAATTDTNVNADGTAEATAINVQGTITTTGVTVQIPVTASGTGTLPAFSTTVNIPAELTEDGTPRDVTLSWASQGYTATTTFITATIAAVGGTLNAKKLDINAGIGNDALGILMGTLNYPYNNAGATTTYQIRDIASIPDRNFGVATTQGTGAGTSGQFHNFLYLPTVAEDGRIWLNHNLGADYTNLNNANFNPGQKATSGSDFRAYGSLFQWGRLSDGHELINWTSNLVATAVNSTTTTLSTTDVPSTRLFITGSTVPNDWRSPQNANLWQGVTGINNPCPIGFRVPTATEYSTLITAANITNDTNTASTILALTSSAIRQWGTGSITTFGSGNYWTSTTVSSNSTRRIINVSSTSSNDINRGASFSVRCIQDTAAPATLTIDCDGKTSAGTLSSGVAASGVSVSIPYTGGNSGWLAGSTVASTGVTGLTATYAGSNNIGTTGNIMFTITGTPATNGTANFNVTVNGVACAFSYNVGLTIPATITLAQNRRHFIASINDSDYLPYQPATTAATTDTNVNADGTAEATAINVQGTITTTGVTVQIPVTASGTGTLPAFSTTVNIPAELTEDGTPRDVTLSWASQGYTATTTFITATIAAVGGTLNAKKLDINAGIGNDALGILMGTLNYPYNNAGATTTYQIRDIASIPDRNFGVATTQGTGAGTSGQFHNFLYLPTVAADGRIWLSHNLGADYTNLNNASFNPGQKPTSTTDFRAYGSLYQWGRLSDGHELINWTSGSGGTRVNGTTTSLSATNVPATRAFIISTSTSNFDWRSTKNDNLWQGVLGVNNPCPQGFRLPTSTEFNALIAAENITNHETALIKNPNFALTVFGGSAGTLINSNGRYWTNTTLADGSSRYRSINTASTTDANASRGDANAVRCIQDSTPPPATLTIDCDGKTSAGTLSSGVAASGVSVSIPYTGGNSGWLAGSTATSTGVTGLTATYAGSNNIGTTGNIMFTITGTPVGIGTATFALNVGGQPCSASFSVFYPAGTGGTGSLSGKTCFDIALGNDNSNSCGPLSARTANQSDFTLAATHTQTYTFTISAVVSNVRFYYINDVGNAVLAITGGNAGNNISTAQTATVNYNTNNNTLALGLTNTNPMASRIFVVYNRLAINNNNPADDRVLALTVNVKDCACCVVKISPTVSKEFLCHNLGANTSLDPHNMAQTNAWGLNGAYIQWGRRGPNTTGDSRVDWVNAANTLNFAAAPSGSTEATANSNDVANWSQTSAANTAWATAGGAKTVNDPCPVGWRVPTQAEWIGVEANNTKSRTSPWGAASYTQYGNALHYGPNATTKLLTLPAAGYRNGINGELQTRGQDGYYWSSTSIDPDSGIIVFDANTVSDAQFPRTFGASVRCIAQ